MKKWLGLLLALLATPAMAQSYPSPTFNTETLQNNPTWNNCSGFALGNGTGSPVQCFTQIPLGYLAIGTGVSVPLANTLNAGGGLPSLNGSFTVGDCIKWSASGLTDSGSGCATGATGITTLTVAGGLSTGGVGSAGGTIATSTGTITSVEPVNAQSGSTYTVASTDNGKLLTNTYAGAGTWTLPQAISNFAAGFNIDILNNGTDLLTVNTSTSTFNGSGSSITIPVGLMVHIVSDGTNWQTQLPAKSGGRYLLNTLVASGSANLLDNTHISSLFDQYEMVFENVLPATTGTTCEVLFYANGSTQVTSYLQGGMYANTGGVANFAGATTFMNCSAPSVVSNAGSGVSGTMKFYQLNASTSIKSAIGAFVYSATASSPASTFPADLWTNVSFPVTGIQVQFNSGNIASGTIKLYGLN